jgi:hypothetical protein
MKSILQIGMGIVVAVMGLATGCGGRPESDSSEQVSSPETVLQQQLRDQLWRYNSAVLRRDVAALKEVVSTEVLNRFDSYPGGIQRFIEKDRKVSLDVFQTMDANDLKDRFTVSDLDVQGDTVSVIPAYDGQSTGRRFYFIKEGDQYKVNVAAPGFSRRLSEGSRASRSNYTVFSDDVPPPGGQLCCGSNSGGYLCQNFAKGFSKVVCQNSCGFFDGSHFTTSGPIEWSGGNACDWHWQGWDIVVNHFPNKYIAFCRDGC